MTNCAEDHSEDAGVVCEGTETLCTYTGIDLLFIPLVECENGYVRLVNDTPNSVFIKDTLSQGRVEICVNETFQTICDDDWDNVDASVLCSELGFSTYG